MMTIPEDPQLKCAMPLKKAATLTDLVAWQVAVELAVLVYRETRSLPRDEVFGLRQQMRKAAVSIANNIAEGHGRVSWRDYLRFVMMSRGSLKELETQITIAARLGFLSDSAVESLGDVCDRLNRLITGLSQSLRKNTKRS